MQTTLYEVRFFDGRVFRVFCRGKNQNKRFYIYTDKLKTEIESIIELSNGIHTISEFEQIINYETKNT
jgi:hypothetical protein